MICGMRLVVVLRPHPARLQVWKRRAPPRTRVPRRRQGACWVGILTGDLRGHNGEEFLMDVHGKIYISAIKHEMNKETSFSTENMFH